MLLRHDTGVGTTKASTRAQVASGYHSVPRKVAALASLGHMCPTVTGPCKAPKAGGSRFRRV